MPSPFPGMNPYLEAHWRDVHSGLLVYIRDALREHLPTSLRVRIEERVVLQSTESETGFYPDVKVVERRPDPYRTPSSTAVAIEPLILDADPPTITEGFIEIIDQADGKKVVTQFEVLSPTNKKLGEARDAYIEKQRAICNSETNLVEIDLLRGDKHVAAVALAHIPLARRGPYLVCVRRRTARRKAEVYPIRLDQPLPTIRIPLRATDPDITLALQPLIEKCYSGYEGDFDYNREPVPPFNGPEAEWADKLLREKGVRQAPPATTSEVSQNRP